ncbi:hypothetical protein [Mycetocola saprophilus]|uniref:hypothetical protein n=1 Tax=Mycetocola saprophilus TaxID=76636 RepID=UPI003BF0CCD4
MNRRNVAEQVGANVAAACASVEDLAEAADMSAPDLNDRLTGVVPFSVTELTRVGGFLRTPAETFLKGVVA